MPTHQDLPYIDTHPVERHDLYKPAPVFNTGIAVLPSFKGLLHDLMRNYNLREVEVVEHLLTFCATDVPYVTLEDFFRQLAPLKA